MVLICHTTTTMTTNARMTINEAEFIPPVSRTFPVEMGYLLPLRNSMLTYRAAKGRS